jgi:hypothetical protein
MAGNIGSYNQVNPKNGIHSKKIDFLRHSDAIPIHRHPIQKLSNIHCRKIKRTKSQKT